MNHAWWNQMKVEQSVFKIHIKKKKFWGLLQKYAVGFFHLDLIIMHNIWKKIQGKRFCNAKWFTLHGYYYFFGDYNFHLNRLKSREPVCTEI